MHATSPNFPIYDSLFKSFPFLRSRSHQMLPASDRQQTSSSAFSSTLIPSLASSTLTAPYPLHASTSSILLGLKHLKTAIIFQTLDPSKQICQYELPGGGVCRDAGCQDMHLSRIADGGDVDVDPNGTCILSCALLVLLAWLMRFYEFLPFYHFIFMLCAARFAVLVFISLSSFPLLYFPLQMKRQPSISTTTFSPSTFLPRG